MAKMTAWLITLIGILLVLVQLKVVNMTDAWVSWVIAVAVLFIGLSKLMLKFSGKKR